MDLYEDVLMNGLLQDVRHSCQLTDAESLHLSHLLHCEVQEARQLALYLDIKRVGVSNPNGGPDLLVYAVCGQTMRGWTKVDSIVPTLLRLKDAEGAGKQQNEEYCYWYDERDFF
jgi:hypothetical protein